MYVEVEFQSSQAVKKFIAKVYGWMALALSITAATAFYIAGHPTLFAKFFSHSFNVILILLGQFLLVVALSMFIMRMSFGMALIAYILYALSMGITCSTIFYVYSMTSISSTFIVASGMFAVMALYGYFTKANLQAMGSFAMMGLFGLIIGLLINLFLQNSQVDLVLSLIGVAIFTMLAAYDMQRIVRVGQTLSGMGPLQDKFAIMGALTLYLDFVNLFLMLLRFGGKQRE